MTKKEESESGTEPEPKPKPKPPIPKVPLKVPPKKLIEAIAADVSDEKKNKKK